MAAPNIYQTIMNAESGGNNVNNYKFDSTHTASGYFQITDSTWATTSAGQNSGVTHAMNADYATQQAAAGELIQRNGLKDWAPYDGINGNVSSYDLTPLSGPNGTPTTAASGTTTLSAPYPQYDANGQLITNPAATVQDAGVTTTTATNAGGATSSTGSVAPANASGVPIAIATGADEQSKTATANTATAVKAATSIYGLTFGTLSDGAMRIALVVVGIVLLAGALFLIGTDEGQSLVKKVGLPIPA